MLTAHCLQSLQPVLGWCSPTPVLDPPRIRDVLRWDEMTDWDMLVALQQDLFAGQALSGDPTRCSLPCHQLGGRLPCLGYALTLSCSLDLSRAGRSGSVPHKPLSAWRGWVRAHG